MKMKQISWILAGALLLLLCNAVGATRGAAQVPTTVVNGIVTDTRGAAITGAAVSATHLATGVVRQTSSNTDGVYAIPDLPAGSYDVHIEATGFAAREFAAVELEAGRATTLDARLEVASVNSTVHVTGAGQTVELTQSMIQGEITSTTIETLPLNGRNFLDLAYLIPGNRPAPNFDPTKTNTLEVSSAGGFGRGGNITVDGGDNNDEVVGGTLANFPQDSVQEFQIATGRFTAEVGRSGNSIINVVTKSGANDYHGSAFLFERNRNLQARPATLDPATPTPPFDRQQYGASVGGPLVKDKTFWFASGEYRHQNSAVLTGERVYGATPADDSILNTTAPAPLREALFSTRVDHQVNASNSLTARYSFNRSTQTAQAEASQPTPLSSAAERQDSLNRFHSLVAGWTSTFSPTQVNNLTFHFDTFLNNIPPFSQDAPTTFPALPLSTELVFPGLADGVNFNTPQSTHLNRYQLRDGFAWTLGTHTLHLGAEFQHYNAFGIINPFGSGSVVLASNFGFADLNGDGVINDLDIPIAVALKSQAPVSPVPIPPISNNYFAAYVQDDWRVTRKLTLNLGLRWEYDTNLTGTDSTHDACADITAPPTKPCVWLAGVIDLRRQPDKKDFGPRVGFAYDPLGHGRTVIRGGYGIYYDRIILEVPGYERVQDDRALTVNAFFGSFCTFPGGPPTPSLGACFAPGATFAPGSPTLANPFSGPNAPGGVGIIVLGKDTHHPMFEQFSLGVQQQLAQDWLFSADALHVFGDRQIIAQYLRSTTSTSPYISCPGSPTLCTVTDPLTGISDHVTVGSSAAKSWYDGLLVSLQHKPAKLGPVTYLFNVSYTLSKTLDYSDDDQVPSFNAVESVNLNEGTAGLRGEKGYAATDERNRLTVYGLLSMPWGFSLSPLYTYGSGVPADTYVSSLPNPSRLPILSRNALGRGIANGKQLNRVIDLWNALPACPAPAPCNPGPQLEHVPAGINFASPFNSLDLRLVKTIRLTEHQHFDLIAESFNLLNNVNVRGFSNRSYSGRNIVLVPKGTDASGIDGSFFAPESIAGGGFFGTGGPRAFQFAIRYSF
jgi:Carboxypeptidase regulatory-like domain/TonB dependent receptor